MKNKIRLVVSFITWILVTTIVFLLIKWCIELKISIWEIINSLFWALITLSIFYAWNKLDKKKDNKAHLLEEVSMIEDSLKTIEESVLHEYEFKKTWTKIKIILQARIKYIANKFEYVCNEIQDEKTKKEWNIFREAITDRFWYEKFIIDDDYVSLFIKNYNILLTKVTEIKKKIINS